MGLIAFWWVNSFQTKLMWWVFNHIHVSTCVHRCSGMDTPHTTCILDPAARGLWYPIGVSSHWAVCREEANFQTSKVDWAGHLCSWHHVWQELQPEKERHSPLQVLHGHQWASWILVSRMWFHQNNIVNVFPLSLQFPVAIQAIAPQTWTILTAQCEAVHHHYFAGKVQRLNLHDGNLVQHVDRGECRH